MAIMATDLKDEAARLSALHRLDILDTPADKTLDRITAMAARLFNAPVAIISLVDRDRIWFKSRHGLDFNQMDRDIGLCTSAILQDGPWVLNDVTGEPLLCDNPLVTGPFGLRFYAGHPLVTRCGYKLGMLCVIDHEPRAVTADQMATLADLAAIVMDHIELRLAACNAERDRAAAREAAELADRARSGFLSIMSHELRTPLNAVMGFSEIIRDGRLGAVAPSIYGSYAGHVHDSAAHLLRLIDDVLDLARIDAGAWKLAPAAVDLTDLLDTVLDGMNDEASRRAVQIVRQRLGAATTGTPPAVVVRVDRDATTHAMLTLVSSALRHSPAGGRIEVAADILPRIGLARVTITDHGPGLPCDIIHHLDDPFAGRGTDVYACGDGGSLSTSLGLAITARLIAAQGGSLTACNPDTGGASLSITLPLCAEAATDAMHQAM
ncbi:GAF domain-containing sensor histidine kinase [Tistrella sp. BH-R2-4]|uniref:histidine kinase n=2 Tax=Geminicoccaceae TaxID=2066434 RepID=A0ABU9YLY3_9PROT